MRVLLILIVVLAVVAGIVWFNAGRAEGPAIEIAGTEQVGQVGEVTVSIEAPEGGLSRVEVHLEQGDRVTKLLADRVRDGVIRVPSEVTEPSPATDVMSIERAGPDQLRLSRVIGKRSIPDLEAGPAEIVVTAVRPVLFGMRRATTTARRTIEVSLTPPQLSVLSTHHYINHGGSEMVVYRVTPPEATSGVRVGEHEYVGFPAEGAGVPSGDPALRVAFFALLPDQEVSTEIKLFARDALGNEGTGVVDYRVFPKQFRNSQIRLSDGFLSRVVPAILQNETSPDAPDPTDLLPAYLWINRDLRKANNETISSLVKQTAPELLWQGPFKQLMNSAVEGGFADQRTYVYQGRSVDEQVHLGFDLASTAAAPVTAANAGRVIHAGWLGIYGNCVILDHGMGLQSLYAHLSSITVQLGDSVDLGETLGRSGATGLAGGDHLHFTMLLGGNAITPIDWWSEKWVQDRVMRKLVDAGMPLPN